MLRLKHGLALGLVTAGALVPGAALAREDEEVSPQDKTSVAIVYAADGTATTSDAPFGTGTFVERLRQSGAVAGAYVSDMSGDVYSPLDRTPEGLDPLDAPDGEHRLISRSGFNEPATRRYARFKRYTKREARSRMSIRHSVNADGERVQEQAYAVDITSGAVRKLSIERAKALSLDPRSGQANTQYVYQAHIRP